MIGQYSVISDNRYLHLMANCYEKVFPLLSLISNHPKVFRGISDFKEEEGKGIPDKREVTVHSVLIYLECIFGRTMGSGDGKMNCRVYCLQTL